MSVERWPPQASAPAPGGRQPGASGVPPERGFAFTVGRAMGKVVVTVHGRLSPEGSALLQDALLDLIDNQGNLDVVVDVRDASAPDPPCLDPFTMAVAAAARRSGEFLVADAPDGLRRALEDAGLGAVLTAPRRRPPTADRDGPSERAYHPAGRALGRRDPPNAGKGLAR